MCPRMTSLVFGLKEATVSNTGGSVSALLSMTNGVHKGGTL